MLKIITHNGKAHRDDFLSVCLLMAISSEEEVVIQRKPAPATWELQDPDIWVLDCGGEFNAVKHNFDHHQEGNPEDRCTLSLLGDVLEYKGVKVVDLLKESKWYSTTCLMDNRGITGVGERLEISRESIMSLGSPVEAALLAQFGRRDLWTRGYILTVMREVGRDLLGYLFHAKEQMATLENQVKVLTWGGQKFLMLEDQDTTGLGRFKEERHPDAAASISLNKRGEGWALYRYDDNPYINFAVLKDAPEIAFVHPGGFLAVTQSKINLKELKKLATAAVISKAE